MNDTSNNQAEKLRNIADELEMAAKHARIAADHFKSGAVPRGCALTLGTEGHVHFATDLLKAVALAHKEKAGLL
ncbi:MAG: hypothetical protein EOP06_32075 [Proteobacteria bacterium]|nr:MAG: hypothetical protein EOP06_32075 [Pseudomonadota bacterium]